MTTTEILVAATWGDIFWDEPDSFDEVEHQHRIGRLPDKQYEALRAAWREARVRSPSGAPTGSGCSAPQPPESGELGVRGRTRDAPADSGVGSAHPAGNRPAE
ncbi:hypothetical protein [Nocardiopsis tropica]|uniref:Uncharacterized protein n=1 Tax=Nocardiopsis tropica TaxID=109330 RepID=A0ABU7KPZ0_9ACTN|nr:hypothetical protein [Nocardiopsis umidischolae]MEE2051202.1 hypothetical protein [Nocardiopsis umidischolae]